jgi:hypothetical protein
VIVECAWCGCIVGEKDGHGLSGITSGICGDCFATILEQIASLERHAAREAETADAEPAPSSRGWRLASGQ